MRVKETRMKKEWEMFFTHDTNERRIPREKRGSTNYKELHPEE